MVGGDAKLLKRLERYASPQAAMYALFAAQNRISSGELLPALKKDASPEEIAAYRAEAGIPGKPEEYDTAIDGVVFGEDDKPFLASFLTAAHGANYRPEQVKAALQWYYHDREAQIEEIVKADDTHRIETVEAMTANWGPESRRNKAMVNALIDEAPPTVAAKIKGARGPEDRALLNDWEVVEWLHSLAFKINPVSTLVPGATGDIGMVIDDEITKWEGQMSNRNSDYWGGKNHDKVLAEKNQARYRDLIAARDRTKPQK